MNFLGNFFQLGPIPSNAVASMFNYHLVILSYIVQVLASYVTLDMGGRLRSSADSLSYQRLWLFGGAFAIGAGTWSMHFIGMLAVDMKMPGGIEFGVDVKYIFFSFLVGFIASIYALHLIKNKSYSIKHLILGGIVFGLAMGLMHYVSMESMRPQMSIRYSPGYFLLSFLIGIVAAEATLWLTIVTSTGSATRQTTAKIISALAISIAMCGVHYTAVLGAVLTPLADIASAKVTNINQPTVLAGIVAIIVILIMGMALVLSTYKQLMSSALQRKNQALIEAMENLKQLQGQLVQSEKMASLGQLIAGISHEINTPAGAILAAVGLVKEDYTSLLQQAITLSSKLPTELSQQYLAVCNKLIQQTKVSLTTADIRKNSQDIEAVLEKSNVDNARQISRNLATIGLTNNELGDIIPLLATPEADIIHQSLFKFGMSQIHIRDIKLAIERIVDLVKALKLYSQVNQGVLRFADLKEQLENTIIILHNKLKRGVTVEKQFEDVPKIKCYAEQLNQVWTNLMNNAIEAMHGSGKIILRLKKQDDTHIQVEIEDNGPGIPNDVLPRIFEPYYTTKQAGTGLGLSIARDIISKNQGEIRVSTQPGKTVFTIVLPLEIPGADGVEK